MTLNQTLAASALALGLIASSFSAQAANTDPASVQAGGYKLETNHARVVFSLSHMGFSTWYGDFSGSTGSLTIDPKNVASAQLSVSIPVASVMTTNAKVDEELKSAAWFDATTYPTITFKSTKVVQTGANSADVTGDLTFHGVTKPVTLQATFGGSGVNMLTKRSDYGVKTYVPLIGDDVDLVISAPFEKQ